MKSKLEIVESFSDFRKKGVGSSDAPAVMGASPWCSEYQLWELKTGRRDPEPATQVMHRGIDLEPRARAAYEQMAGIRMPIARQIHKEHDFIRANFDGINKMARTVLEIKCPGRTDHDKAKAGLIPDKYLWQCVHLLAVSRMPVLHYWSFDGENGVLVKVKRDRLLEEKLLAKEKRFWEYVTTDTAPPVEVFKTRRNR